MVVEMHAGLASDGGSKLKMLLTFVDALPNGYGPQGPSLLAALHCYSVRRLALRFPLLFLAICRPAPLPFLASLFFISAIHS
jgi:hypothetical protein